MALNIKDAETEQLATDVAKLAGESKTRAVNIALRERKERLRLSGVGATRYERLMRVLEDEVWPQIPEEVLGTSITKEEREEILGIGPDGY